MTADIAGGLLESRASRQGKRWFARSDGIAGPSARAPRRSGDIHRVSNPIELAASQRRTSGYIPAMSTVQEIQAAIPKLTPEEQAELKGWMADYFEDPLELTDEVKAKLDRSRAEIAAGEYRSRQP
jgi:hypothetical protein